jgi:hypothetical protein
MAHGQNLVKEKLDKHGAQTQVQKKAEIEHSKGYLCQNGE